MLTVLKDTLLGLLRWSERYTRTDMVYLARGGFWSLLSQAIGVGIAFVLLIAMGHFLPKDVYGQYKYVLSFIALLSMLGLNGIPSAVFQSVARGFDGALRQGFRLNLRWSVLLISGALAACAYYLFAGNKTLAIAILIGGCCTPIIASANLYTSFLTGKKDFASRTLIGDLGANVVPALILIATIFYTSDPTIVIAVYFISNACVDLAAYVLVRRMHHPDDSKRDPALFSFSKHLSAMGILGGIANNIDQILLFHYVGAAQLATYSFATTILNQVRGQVKNLDIMTQAQFANRPTREIEAGMLHKMALLFITSILGIGAYIVIAPYFYGLLFPQYVDAVSYSQLYALSFLGIFVTPAASYLAAKKRVRELYIDNVIHYAIQIGLMVVGVILWGIWGLIAARVIARLLDAILVLVLYAWARNAEISRETAR